MSHSDQEEEGQEPQYESDCEDLEDYKRDGYHPTYIGETFMNGRYLILQKLGWGHFSTVWLAEDKHFGVPGVNSPARYVALKIQKSKESYSEAAEDEIQILKAMKEAKTSEEWAATREELRQKGVPLADDDTFCIEILNNFPHFGMHGKHYCSTFRIMGPNLLDLIRFFEKKYDRGIPIPIVKKIAVQLLIGLDYMHRICKVIHTDLKPENVMLDLSTADFDQFIHELKSLKTLPLSMKYLKSVQTSSKNKKKKKKKKTADGTNQGTKSAQDSELMSSETNSNAESVLSAPTNNPALVAIDTSGTHLSQAVNELEIGVPEGVFKKQLGETAEQGQILEEKLPEVSNLTSNKFLADSTHVPDPVESIHQSESIQNELDVIQSKGDEPIQHPVTSKPEQMKDDHTSSVEIIEPPKPQKSFVKNKAVQGEFSRDEGDDDDSHSSSIDAHSQKSSGSYYQKKEFVFYWKDKMKVTLNENIRIKIVDFGNACWTFKHFTDNIQTREYRSPEALVGAKYNQSTDMWSVACMIFELLTGDYLFRPQSGRDEPRDEIHLALFISTLGKLPKKFTHEGKYSRELFNKSGKLLHAKVPEDYTMDQILVSEYNFDIEDAKQIRDFLTPMLEYDIEKRMTALDALKSPWLWT
jgi:serine/threonine protein kinase